MSTLTFDRYSLRRSDAAARRSDYRAAGKSATLRIEIEGHTCNIGTAEYNLGSATGARMRCADYLVSRGTRRPVAVDQPAKSSRIRQQPRRNPPPPPARGAGRQHSVVKGRRPERPRRYNVEANPLCRLIFTSQPEQPICASFIFISSAISSCRWRRPGALAVCAGQSQRDMAGHSVLIAIGLGIMLAVTRASRRSPRIMRRQLAARGLVTSYSRSFTLTHPTNQPSDPRRPTRPTDPPDPI